MYKRQEFVSFSLAIVISGVNSLTADGSSLFTTSRQAENVKNNMIVRAKEPVIRNRFFFLLVADVYKRQALPNAAHRKLAQWEAEGKLRAVITQNIDGLHQKAGSRRVLELHGSVLRNHCMRCGASYGVETIVNSEGVPRCSCGGIIKPDVVLYEEGLDEDVLMQSVSAIRQADVLIIGGTSLTVYPAAGLVRYYRGDVYKRQVLN